MLKGKWKIKMTLKKIRGKRKDLKEETMTHEWK